MSKLRPDDLRLALSAFTALSDETRFRIAAMLGSGPMTVSEITDELDASQPLVSFHLRQLGKAGLVQARRTGMWVRYSLNRKAIERLERIVGRLVPDRIEGGG
jgi:ArsR family transcriptional regulator